MKLTVRKVRQIIAACREQGVRELAFDDFRISFSDSVPDRVPAHQPVAVTESQPASVGPETMSMLMKEANALNEWFHQKPPADVVSD